MGRWAGGELVGLLHVMVLVSVDHCSQTKMISRRGSQMQHMCHHPIYPAIWLWAGQEDLGVGFTLMANSALPHCSIAVLLTGTEGENMIKRSSRVEIRTGMLFLPNCCCVGFPRATVWVPTRSSCPLFLCKQGCVFPRCRRRVRWDCPSCIMQHSGSP